MKKIKITPNYLEELFSQKLTEIKQSEVTPASFSLSINPTIKLADEAKVKVVFHQMAYKKMKALVDQCGKEIGWHGIVERVNEKRFEITDIVVFPQVVTGATVTPDAAKYSQWFESLALEGIYDVNKLRFHGHSHVNMSATPSGVDTDYQTTVTLNIPDFYIFGIFNKSEKYWFNIMDFANNTLYENDDIKYLYIPDEADNWAGQMIKQYVEEPPKAQNTTVAINDYSGWKNPDMYDHYYGGYYRGKSDISAYGGYSGASQKNKNNKSGKGYNGVNFYD